MAITPVLRLSSGNTPAVGVLWQSLARSGTVRRKNLLEADAPKEESDQLVDLVPRCMSSVQHHTLSVLSDLWRKEVAGDEASPTGPKTDPASSPEIASRWSPRALLYGVVLTASYVTEMIGSTLIPRLTFPCPYTPRLCSSLCAANVNSSEPLYLPIIPFRKHRKSSRHDSKISQKTYKAISSHRHRAAFHRYLYISTINPSLRHASPSIPHHVFRPENQIRTGNQYPFPLPSPTLQPRNERLLEMLQVPTHKQPSGIITLLRQLPTRER